MTRSKGRKKASKRAPEGELADVLRELEAGGQGSTPEIDEDEIRRKRARTVRVLVLSAAAVIAVGATVAIIHASDEAREQAREKRREQILAAAEEADEKLRRSKSREDSAKALEDRIRKRAEAADAERNRQLDAGR